MVDRRTAAPRLQVEAALAELMSSAAPATVDRITPVALRFANHLVGANVLDLQAVTPVVARSFVTSRLGSGQPPSLATMHERRSIIRLVFRAARRIGLVDHDPTIDLELPPKSTSVARPLTDTEIAIARDVALWSLASRRIAATWAIAEATGRGAELAGVAARDIDLLNGRVWLSGGARTNERWGALSEWGVTVLRARLGELEGADRLVFGGDAARVGQVSTCHAISTVLVRAGLAGERDVRPMSVAGWAGRRVFDETGDLAAAARALGVRSLDQAAQLVGYDWKS